MVTESPGLAVHVSYAPLRPSHALCIVLVEVVLCVARLLEMSPGANTGTAAIPRRRGAVEKTLQASINLRKHAQEERRRESSHGTCQFCYRWQEFTWHSSHQSACLEGSKSHVAQAQ